MTEQPTNWTAAAEEKTRPCFVRHEDAGGRCGEPAVSGADVYGLHFCAAHGDEVRIGAALEEHQDAAYFFERFRSPAVPKLDSLIDRELSDVVGRLSDDMPGDEDHHRALVGAYLETVPDAVRARTLAWEQDEASENPYGHTTVVDYLLDSLGTLHKLMRLAHADGETWIVEVLEIERESVAAQAAVALENAEFGCAEAS